MKKICFFLFFSITLTDFSISLEVIAEKESLTTIQIGPLPTQIFYFTSDEGFFSPGPPLIDNEARLWFVPNGKDNVLIFANGQLSAAPFPAGSKKPSDPQNFPSSNQQGRFGFSWVPSELNRKLADGITLKNIDSGATLLFPIQCGVVYQYVDYYQHYQIASIEYKPNIFSMEKAITRNYVLRNPEETRAWLSTQPGGFSIGNDGLLYRNGFIWSAQKTEGVAGDYIGKLMSGHNVYQSGERYFRITNSTGVVEVVLEMPWATDPDKAIFHPYNFGLGPWGEFYCLIPPAPKFRHLKESSYPYWDSGESELVVVRNHLKYFGRLNDGGVRLRKEPTTSGEILGTYPAKTGFRILTTGTKSETIGGQTNVWYKVRLLDGTEGWFFGAFVHNLYDGPNGNPPPWPNVPDW